MMTAKEVIRLLRKLDLGKEISLEENHELLLIEELNCEGIKKIPKSIERLVSLKKLDLSYVSSLKDISFVRNLKGLIELDLSGTEISDISALEELRELRQLDLSYTKVKDLSALKGLTTLTRLDLKRIKVEDLSVLKGLTALTRLSLRETKVKNLSALKSLMVLTWLDLSHTDVNDISALKSLTALTWLDLSHTDVNDISALKSLTALTRLSLQETKVKDLSALKSLMALTWLDLSHTDVNDISALKELTALTELDLSNNDMLNDITGITGLKNLKRLILAATNIIDIRALSNSKTLSYLDLSETQVTDINALSELKALKILNLGYTKVSDIDALKEITELEYLDLSITPVKSISALSKMSSLVYLGLRSWRHTSELSLSRSITSQIIFGSDPYLVMMKKKKDEEHQINRLFLITYKETGPANEMIRSIDIGSDTLNDPYLPDRKMSLDLGVVAELVSLKRLELDNRNIKNLSFLSTLKELTAIKLFGAEINDIVDLCHLKKLKAIDLRYATIPYIPEGLVDLNINFVSDEVSPELGIHINGLTLTEQPIELFSQSRELIREYYRNHSMIPINECKVVFLGDGGAGKTHAIKRLLNDGLKNINFTGNTTPGIEITVSQAFINNGEITVNYWDFGGQEILHSMHRMFLTKRTLYVIFVNARDNTQDERARYWLHNVKNFANEAPVLLVINQIDQNRNASVNEKNLRGFYKHLKHIIKMSALEDSQEEFNNNLRNNIYAIISEMDSVQAKIPKPWKEMMQKVREKTDDYLTLKQFIKLCIDLKIENYEKIKDDLIGWLQILGISFRYRERNISGQMLLNPKWLVNAIYIILFNGRDISKNGILSYEDIYNLLENDEIAGKKIQRVLKDVHYEDSEVNYILGVIRSFRLSYQLGNNEFFPMLCGRNEKISPEEIMKDTSRHFIFRYEYLPENVLHRLIVDFRRDLDYENVWFTGAVFRNKERCQIAYVRKEDNDLHVYVDGSDNIYNPNEYLMPICDCVKAINRDMGISAKEYVTYVVNGLEVEFSYKALIGSLHKGNRTIYSEEADDNVDIKDILARYDEDPSRQESKLLSTILTILEKLQNNEKYYSASEDECNTYIRDLLDSAGYSCYDQTYGGVSETKNSPGKLDIKIKGEGGRTLTIFEALKLRGFSKTSKAYLDKHIKKLLDNYNPGGLSSLFLVSYTSWSKNNFLNYSLNYADYIQSSTIESFIPIGQIVHIKTDGFLRCMKLTYDCGGIPMNVYHILVRVAK